MAPAPPAQQPELRRRRLPLEHAPIFNELTTPGRRSLVPRARVKGPTKAPSATSTTATASTSPAAGCTSTATTTRASTSTTSTPGDGKQHPGPVGPEQQQLVSRWIHPDPRHRRRALAVACPPASATRWRLRVQPRHLDLDPDHRHMRSGHADRPRLRAGDALQPARLRRRRRVLSPATPARAWSAATPWSHQHRLRPRHPRHAAGYNSGLCRNPAGDGWLQFHNASGRVCATPSPTAGKTATPCPPSSPAGTPQNFIAVPSIPTASPGSSPTTPFT